MYFKFKHQELRYALTVPDRRASPRSAGRALVRPSNSPGRRGDDDDSVPTSRARRGLATNEANEPSTSGGGGGGGGSGDGTSGDEFVSGSGGGGGGGSESGSGGDDADGSAGVEDGGGDCANSHAGVVAGGTAGAGTGELILDDLTTDFWTPKFECKFSFRSISQYFTVFWSILKNILPFFILLYWQCHD